MILFFILSPLQIIKAEEPATNVTEIVEDLLTSALKNNSYFNLPDLMNQEIYVCSPISPFLLSDNQIKRQEDIEYYLLCTQDKYIACIVLCYNNDVLVSASLNTDISSMLEDSNLNLQAFSLIASGGDLYIKTSSEVIIANKNCNEEDATVFNQDDILLELESFDIELCEIDVLETIDTSNFNIASPRSSTVLDVPYVSQNNYNICWAAAAAALGRYYTGSTYAQYSAYDLASMVGVGNQGAGIDKSMQILSSIFKINTTYTSSMLTSGTIVNYINMRKPILVGFSNSKEGHMVVLCGYDDGGNGSNMKYYVRDSNYSGSYQIVKPMSNGIIGMDYYSGIMYWNEAAYRN